MMQGSAKLGERGGKPMKVTSAVTSGMLASILSPAAHAFPGSPSRIEEASILIPVKGGCGRGNHRNNEGGCVSGPPAKVRRLPSGDCPPGSHLGNKGRN